MRTISEQCYKRDQNWYYDHTFEDSGHKLRIYIRRNAYDHQSEARVERWDGSQWHRVHWEPIELCECRRISYLDKDVDPIDFEPDFNRLFNAALQIVTDYNPED